MCEGGCECGGMCGLAFNAPKGEPGLNAAGAPNAAARAMLPEPEFMVVLCGCEPGGYCETCNPEMFCLDCGGDIYGPGAPAICAAGHMCSRCHQTHYDCECDSEMCSMPGPDEADEAYRQARIADLVGNDALNDWVTSEIDRMTVKAALEAKMISLVLDLQRLYDASAVIESHGEGASLVIDTTIESIHDEIVSTVIDWKAACGDGS